MYFRNLFFKSLARILHITLHHKSSHSHHNHSDKHSTEMQGYNFKESYESPFGFSWVEFAIVFGLSSIQFV